MFGIYRFVLSLFVVITHLSGAPLLEYLGGYALYGFFILSGYLMTLIMNKTYGYSSIGLKKFLVNRFLRIYPIYYVSALISIVLILVFGSNAAENFEPALKLPDDFRDYFSNIFIFGSVAGGLSYNDSRLSPTAWALEIELFFYIVIALFLGKNKRIALKFLLFSIAARYILTLLNIIGLSGLSTYSSLPATALPFSLGVFMYHWQLNLEEKFRKIHSCIPNKIVLIQLLITLFIVNYIFGFLPWIPYGNVIAFEVNIFIMFLIVFVLKDIKIEPSNSLGNLDAFLGGLSYPIYLIHYQIAFFILEINVFEVEKKGFKILFISTIFIILISTLMHLYVDKYVEKIRRKIKRA